MVVVCSATCNAARWGTINRRNAAMVSGVGVKGKMSTSPEEITVTDHSFVLSPVMIYDVEGSRVMVVIGNWQWQGR